MNKQQENLLNKAIVLVHYLKLLAKNKDIYQASAKAELELNRLMVQLTSLPDSADSKLEPTLSISEVDKRKRLFSV